ncbi:hypothetical protein Ddye_009164 [Dipteronia dyeriana]|uniref:Uncharacterized protein n=1 Tax=Dipteronia dyeriana TaxID=168575 RepID=A0AAE0CM04_9ROSI|nr:hypothetical protein Ddye_009164 [Dipteronia dyeriana]
MAQYLNQQNNPMTRGGLISGHIVINRDRKSVDRHATDEYIKIGESTTIESLKRFCRAVVEEFTDEYLRSPNTTDVARLLRIDEHDVTASIEDHMEAPTPEVEMMLDENTLFQQFLARHRGIRDKDAHIALRNALIDHLWDEYTNSDN